MRVPRGYEPRIGAEVPGALRIRSRDAVMSPSIGPLGVGGADDGGVGAGGAVGCATTVRGGAMNVTMNGTSPETPLASNCDIGLGSAFGSWGGGLVHDWTHSYNPLIAFALVSVVLGMIPFLVVPALRR